jgi:subtilisin-like proprotein convertase family protein
MTSCRKNPAAMAAAAAIASLAGLTTAPASAQSCNSYTLTTNSGQIEPGVADIGIHCDDCTSAVQTLPFPVSLYGTTYTSYRVSSNGNLQFTTNIASLANNCLPSATMTGPTIMAHWDDMHTGGAGEGVFTSLTGDPGSQRFNVEWRTHYFGATGTANFAISFYEGQDFFEIIYGAVANGGTSATIGVQAGGATGASTQHSCNTAGAVSDGLALRFTCATISTPPTGIGSATPNNPNNCGTATTLLTVATTPGANPPSTGITVVTDLSQIGGVSAQSFYDDGTHGDVTAGDNRFSFLATIPNTVSPAAYVLPFNVRDAQSRSSSGNINMSVVVCPPPPPANNDCSAASPIAGGGTFPFNNASATTDGVATATCTQIYKDVWFAWTPTRSGSTTFETCATAPSFDTKIAVYPSGVTCPTGATTLACNDDACGLLSRTTATVTAGETYLVRVGNFSSSAAVGGAGVLTVIEPPVPTGACCTGTSCSVMTQADCTSAGGAYRGDNAACTTTTYAHTYSADPNLTIPDDAPEGVTSTINIPDDFSVSDVAVEVRIPDHTYIGDLIITLTKNGTTVRVWNRLCGTNAGMDVTFADSGVAVVCAQPTVGEYLPDEALSSLSGPSSTGDWTLTVSDNAGVDVGTLTHWELRFNRTTGNACQPTCRADVNGDGTVNVQDFLSFLQLYAAGDIRADMDGSGFVNVQDFLRYLQLFAAGC